MITVQEIIEDLQNRNIEVPCCLIFEDEWTIEFKSENYPFRFNCLGGHECSRPCMEEDE